MKIYKQKIILLLILLFSQIFVLSENEVENISKSNSPSEEAFVAINDQGEIGVVWVEKISDSIHKIYYSIRRNGKWSSPKPIRNDLSSYNSLPHIAKGRNSGFVCTWHDESTQQIKMSAFNGQEWSKPVVVSQTGGYHLRFPKISTSSKKIVVTWEKGDPIRPEIFSKLWLNNWKTIINISQTPEWTSKENDIYTDKNGITYVVWREKKLINDVAHYYVMMNYNDSSGNWHKSFYVTDGNNHPYKPIVAVNDNEDILVGYYDSTSASYSSNIKINGQWKGPFLVGDRGNHQEHDFYYADACGYNDSFLYIFRDVSLNIRYAVWKDNEWVDYKITTSGNTYHPSIDYKSDVGIVAVWTDRNENDVFVKIFTADERKHYPPVAGFTYHPEEGLYPLEVEFDASPSYDRDGYIVKYKWNFGDGEEAEGIKVKHTFKKKGEYIVTLEVTDNEGYKSSAFHIVKVLGLYLPLNQKYSLLENKTLFVKEYFYRITWEKNPKNSELTKVIAYKIYRKKEGTSQYKLITKVDSSVFKFYDRNIDSKNRHYKYCITALDIKGRESNINDCDKLGKNSKNRKIEVNDHEKNN